MVFKKGKISNPKGRPRGVPNKKTELMNAIKYVQGKKGKKLLVHAVEQAYEDKAVLVALLKKLIPDLKMVEVEMNTEPDKPMRWEVVFKKAEPEKGRGNIDNLRNIVQVKPKLDRN